MRRERHLLPLVCLSLVVGWPTSAPAATYSLCGNSGGQLHIGNVLPLPLQAPATAATTTTMFPPLLVPLAAGAPPVITGTSLKPLLTAMATPSGPVTKSGYQRKLMIPVGVLSKPAAQKTRGIKSVSPTLFAAATNLKFAWPAAPAVFSTGMAVPTATVTGFSGSMTYTNTLGARFGGAAQFVLTPGAAAGLYPASPVTLYFKINATTPPCTHPVFGGAMPGCLAGIMFMKPTGVGGVGGAIATTVMTPGAVVTPPNVVALKMGATPLGTILAALKVATAPLPTNMATSQPGPWTTGQIIISHPGAPGGAQNFTLSGKDMRTAGGGGAIHLVSGSLSTRVVSGASANRGWIRLNMKPAAAPSPVQLFEVFGTSNAVAWSWRIAIGGTTVASATNVGPITTGGGPALFASAFISSINSNAGTSGCLASSTANPNQFDISCTCDFEFFVADASGTPGSQCLVTGALGGSGCPFNPTIRQVVPGVPMLTPWGFFVLSCLLVAVFLTVALSRRSATRNV